MSIFIEMHAAVVKRLNRLEGEISFKRSECETEFREQCIPKEDFGNESKNPAGMV